MFKKVSKSLISVVLVLCITVSVFSVSLFSVSAGFLTDKLYDKLYDIGMRVACEVTETLGEATGVEQIENTSSFIAKWIFMDASEAAVAKTQELCEEILARLDEIETEMNEGFAQVEQQLGKNEAKQAKKNLDDAWNNDVDNVIKSAKAELVLSNYQKYMEDALQFKKDGLEGEELQNAVQGDLDNLIKSFGYMYGEIDIDDWTIDQIKDHIFTNTKINADFIELISSLANNLCKDNVSSVSECAAQYAYSYFPFSHQQYQFISDVMEKQIMELLQVEMVYNEYLYQQGEYIKQKNGVESSSYQNYLTLQRDFYNLMKNGDSCVDAKISDMVSQEMEVDLGVKMTLDDYMRPEDAVSTTLKINDYQSSFACSISVPNSKPFTVKSNSKYIKNTVKFNRVMTNGGGTNSIYYIIDPKQYSNKEVFYAQSLDYKYNVAFGDTHITSCDYINLIKNMTDGQNTFSCPKDISKLNNLFNNNAFRIYSSKPSNYLENYLPEHGPKTTYFITPGYKNPVKDNLGTDYEHFQLIDADQTLSGTPELKAIDVNAKDIQPNRDGPNDRYSVILSNNSDTYSQKARLKSVGDGISSASINVGDKEVVGLGSEAVIKSGEMLTIKFKLDDKTALKSLKCVRNSDVVTNKAQKVETVLLDEDDLNNLTPDGDGYYTLSYPMPYSDTTFEIETTVDTGKNKTIEINNADDLVEFSNDVNSGCYAYTTVNLNSDINLLGYENKFSPIGTNDCPFMGTFNGNNKTILGLNLSDTSSYSGLFGNVSNAVIKDLNVAGNINLSSDRTHVGGVIANINGGTVSNVHSSVNISNTSGTLIHVGGVIGSVGNGSTKIEKCIYDGKINVANSTDCIGGIVGYTNQGAAIRDCANLGTVNASKSGAYTGGILGYVNNSYASVSNCYNYGTVSNAGNTNYCGAIIGWARYCDAGKITNNFYLNISSPLAFGKGSRSGISADSKNESQFASGEVTYKLNNGITDGSQVWYQNVDNTKGHDKYPTFIGDTVYYIDTREIYSNGTQKYEFSTDDDGNLIIKSYDDLVKLSKLMDEKYNVYGSLNYVLTNNIEAPAGSQWTKGIGSESKPFNGTFDGQGYCIIGLKINNSKYASLFENIGENGCVKQLLVIESSCSGNPEISGGIAAVNNGTIDHCLSGINMDENSEYNSIISGQECGGVVGENNGKIIGSRNAAIVTGNQCGGIASVNTGSIYACANNAIIGDAGTEIAGGLVGKNSGSIVDSYNSGAITGSSEKTTGSIAGLNDNKGTDELPLKNNFYSTENGMNFVGTDSKAVPDGKTNLSVKRAEDFKDDTYVIKLNYMREDESVTWCRGDGFNNGYPYIYGDFVIHTTKSAGNNITVEGNMHKDLNITYDVCDKNSSEYKNMASSIGNRTVKKMYSASVTDNNGINIPAELWYQGDLKISLPVDSKDIMLASINSDGQVSYLNPDSVEDGLAVFTVAEPESFAIVENNSKTPDSPSTATNINSDNGSSNSSDNGNNSSVQKTNTTLQNDNKTVQNDNSTVQTGVAISGGVLLVAAIALVFAVGIKKRNNIASQ